MLNEMGREVMPATALPRQACSVLRLVPRAVDDFVTVIHCAMNGKELPASLRGKVAGGANPKAGSGAGSASGAGAGHLHGPAGQGVSGLGVEEPAGTQ